MNPTPNAVHVDAVLTNVSLATVQANEDFIARSVFPVVPVDKQSDLYFEWDKGDFLRADTKERAPASESAGSGFRVQANDPYYCRVRALHSDLADQTRANADMNVEQAITSGLTQDALLTQEIDWADKYFKTGVWTSETTPGNLWDTANGTPFADIRDMKRQVRDACGRMPNTIVFGGEAWDKFLDNDSVVDRFKHTMAGGQTTKEKVANMFGLSKCLVGNAIQNTANEGAAVATSPILGKHVMLCYSAPSPSLMLQSAGYTFAWTGLLGANAAGMAVSQFRMDHLKADRIEIESAYDQKLVSADCGGLLLGVIS